MIYLYFIIDINIDLNKRINILQIWYLHFFYSIIIKVLISSLYVDMYKTIFSYKIKQFIHKL